LGRDIGAEADLLLGVRVNNRGSLKFFRIDGVLAGAAVVVDVVGVVFALTTELGCSKNSMPWETGTLLVTVLLKSSSKE
jgi:hypothetical protein